MAQRTALAVFVMALSLCFLLPAVSNAGVSEEAKVQASTAVMKEIMEIPESAIPPSLLASAHGIAIFPDLLKAGFILGGRYGVGVMLVRNEDRSWSNPVFFRLIGGSIGWQIGVQSTDVILVTEKHSQPGCNMRRQVHSRGRRFDSGGSGRPASRSRHRHFAQGGDPVLFKKQGPFPWSFARRGRHSGGLRRDIGFL